MPEKSTLLQKRATTSLHYLVSVSVALGKFGDSVEFYLPAVITQPASCELGISKSQEHFLALALYISTAVVSLITIPFVKKYPRRPIILFSLYLSVIGTVFCALVPDYMSLLISRVLLGITISISTTPLSVYLSEMSPTKQFYERSVVAATIGWFLGSGWCGVLGYLFLEQLGWRWFVLLTSIPVFLPPIIAFQFFLPESQKQIKEDPDNDEVSNILETDEVATSTTAMISRLIKLQLFVVLRTNSSSGAMLLLPAIMKDDNIRHNRGGSACNAIHGAQFLSMTLIFGACRLLGMGLGYVVHARNMTSAAIFTSGSVIVSLALGMILYYVESVSVVLAGLSIVQIASAICIVKLDMMSYDRYFFTKSFLPISCGLRLSLNFLSILVTNVISEVLSVFLALEINLGVSIATIICSLLFCLEDV